MWHKEIDITGLVCPMTFVRAKLAIEPMSPGQTLRIVLDYEEATRSIPRSMAELGHETLGVEPVGDARRWAILVRKGALS